MFKFALAPTQVFLLIWTKFYSSRNEEMSRSVCNKVGADAVPEHLAANVIFTFNYSLPEFASASGLSYHQSTNNLHT